MLDSILDAIKTSDLKALGAAVVGAVLLKIVESITVWRSQSKKHKDDLEIDAKNAIRNEAKDIRDVFKVDNHDLRVLLEKKEDEATEWRDKYYDALKLTLELREQIMLLKMRYSTGDTTLEETRVSAIVNVAKAERDKS